MELKRGYMKTEVGVIPEDWDLKPLSTLPCLAIDCHHSTPSWKTSGELVIRNQNIRDGRLDLSEPSFTDEENYLERVRRAVPRHPDLVITREAPMGQVCMIPAGLKCCLGQRMVLLRIPSDDVDPAYVLHALQSQASQRFIASVGGTGSTVSNIRIPILKSLPVPTPPINEQRSIAAALGDINALIMQLERLIAKNRNIKQAAMQELLTGKRRLPGFEGEWEVKRLGEVATLSKGDQLHSSEAEEGGKFAHLNGGITPSGYTNKSNTPANSIAISEGGNSCGYVQFMTEPYWCGGHCYSVYPNGIDKVFLYHALKGQQTAIMGLRVGSGLPNVQKASLLSFKLRFPATVPEQTAIASVLTEMDAELTALDQWREKTRAIKQALMQELLTGRTRLV